MSICIIYFFPEKLLFRRYTVFAPRGATFLRILKNFLQMLNPSLSFVPAV